MGGGGGGGLTITISGGATGVTTSMNLLPGTDIGITNPGAGADIQIAFTGQLAVTKAQIASKWLDSYDSVTGAFTSSQPAFSDISGTASTGQIPALPYDPSGAAATAQSNAEGYADGLILTEIARANGAYDPLGAAATKLSLTGGTLTGDLLFSTDNAHDVGASGATRPRTIFVGTSILAPLFNAATGFQIAGAATTGHVLRGDGTNYVDAQLAYGDLSGTPALTFLPLAGGTLTGDLLFSTDNAHDIGATGATRPRNVFAGTDVITPKLDITTNAGTVSVIGQTGSAAYSFALPTSAGSSGNLLSTDGTGILSWVSPGASTLPNRSTVTVSGGSLNAVASGAVVKGTVTLGKSCVVQRVISGTNFGAADQFPVRVRLYNNQVSRDADAGTSNGAGIDRPYTLIPSGYAHGILFDLYLDGGYNALAAIVSTVNLTSNVVTVTTAQNHGLSTGQLIKISTLQKATFLNGATLTLLSGSGSTFTATYNYANYVDPGGETGIIFQENFRAWNLSPAAEGVSDPTAATAISSTLYYAITNLDTVTRNLAVTFNFTLGES
jgi:hypothetical protein